MIEKMKKVVILAGENSKKKLLVSLRHAGVMHIHLLTILNPSGLNTLVFSRLWRRGRIRRTRQSLMSPVMISIESIQL